MWPQVPSHMHLPLGENATKLSNMSNRHKLGMGATQGRRRLMPLAQEAMVVPQLMPLAEEAMVVPPLMPLAEEAMVVPPLIPREIMPIPISQNHISDHNSITSTCPIFLEYFKFGEAAGRLHCGHIYHQICISISMRLTNNCLLCRREFQ
jgi:hypothetical protein